jgi:[acyl-carrier-protein] S-malonyltransferase
MKAFVFPGQASQFVGMGKDMYEASPKAKSLFDKADEILNFDLSKVMFEGTEEDLMRTDITQPAVFLHSVIKFLCYDGDLKPDVVAGHSLGEFSALVANNCLDFEEALKLVYKRAQAMQKACELQESTMAAIIGLENEKVEELCAQVDDIVVPANYNCPGQLVISGSVPGVEKAVELMKEAGALKAVILQVGGAFHSPLMEPAKEELELAINSAKFKEVSCPIYQNVTALKETDPEKIRENLINQLTSPVRWTQTLLNMLDDGIEEFVEVGGKGRVLAGFVRRIDRKIPSQAL